MYVVLSSIPDFQAFSCNYCNIIQSRVDKRVNDLGLVRTMNKPTRQYKLLLVLLSWYTI